MATAGTNRLVKLWDPITGQECASLASHTGEVNALAFDSAGDLLATGGTDETVRLWKACSR